MKNGDEYKGKSIYVLRYEKRRSRTKFKVVGFKKGFVLVEISSKNRKIDKVCGWYGRFYPKFEKDQKYLFEEIDPQKQYLWVLPVPFISSIIYNE